MTTTKKVLLGIAASAPVSALAEGASGTSRVPTEFTTALGDLQATGTAAAGALAPFILEVGVAFAVLALLFVAFRYFRRSAK